MLTTVVVFFVGSSEMEKVLETMEKKRGTAKPLCSVQSSSNRAGSQIYTHQWQHQ